jgi:2,5-furandicarboxylate decarboxylase 1
MQDLRSFLDLVRQERPRELVEVKRLVSPKYVTTAILTKLEQAFRFPTLLFHKLEGSPFPTVTNVCGSKARLALALRCSVGELSRTYGVRCSQPVKPELLSDGPVHEHVLTGDEVDLRCFPQFIYHEDDAPQAYITAAIVVARDPETGLSNLSYHRLMIVDQSTTAIFMARGKHLDRIYRKYEAAGEAMPVAVFLGVHPVCSLGAVYTGGPEVEEYDIIGGLQQAPLALVQCVTNSLQVPAAAEFAIEGFIPPGVRVPEGPFGEFTGYSTGVGSCPVFKVRALTYRSRPIYQDIVSGHAEHLLLPVLAIEENLLAVSREAAPGTIAVRVPLPLTACVALEKTDDAQPRRIMNALLQDLYVKQVIVVDADVDPSDIRQVATAVALHVRADRDVSIHPITGTELDPAAEPNGGTTAKLGLDATRRLDTGRQVRKNRVPQHVLDSINVAELLATP